jgi:O-succinylbenzoate synthase
VINIKPGRVGGLSVGRAIHDLCRARGVPVWCGGMLETGIGRAANLALAGLPGFTLPGDLSASARYFPADIITEPFVLNAADSTMTVPTGPGLGVTVDEAELRRVTRSRETVG